MYLIKIYLTNGTVIDFNCEEYEISQNKATGNVSGYCFKNANKCIAYLDKTQIAVITSEKV